MQKPQITNSKSQTNHKSKNPKQFWSLGLRSLGIIWNLVLGIWNFQKREVQNGFTLLETIVAFAVIFAALIGPVSLITRGLIDVTFAKNKLVALNLAQEGIEFVRLARDNNVLCDFLDGGAVGSIPWNRDSSGSGVISDNPQPRRADIYTLDALPCGTVNSARLSGGAAAPLRVDVDGFYQYGGVGGFTTPFRRRITITMVDVGGGVMDRMDVISEVTWTERGRSRTVTLKDALYNWR